MGEGKGIRRRKKGKMVEKRELSSLGKDKDSEFHLGKKKLSLD